MIMNLMFPEAPVQDGNMVVLLRERTVIIEKALACLKEQQRKVISLRCGLDGDPMSFSEVGRTLGLSSGYVRNVFTRALNRLWWNCGTNKFCHVSILQSFFMPDETIEDEIKGWKKRRLYHSTKAFMENHCSAAKLKKDLLAFDCCI